MVIKKLLQKAIYKYLYELRLQSKLVIAFFIMSFILFFISYFCISSYVTSFIEEQLIDSATETFDQTTTALQNTFYTFEQISTGLARGRLFDELMSTNMENYTPGQITQTRHDFEQEIFALLRNHIAETTYEQSFKIYFNDGFDYFNNNTRYFSLKNYEKEPWCQIVIQNYALNRGGFYIIPERILQLSPQESPGSVALIRVAMDKDYYPHILAFMRIDIPTAYLNQLITTTTFDNTISAVINTEKDILASSVSFSQETLSSLLSNYDLTTFAPEVWNSITLDSKPYFLRMVRIKEYGLVHFTLIPANSLYKNLQPIKFFLFLITIFLCLCSIPIASIIARTLIFRLKNIENVMNNVRHGNLVRFQDNIPHGTDEMGNLITSYNYMIEQMELLMEQEYVHGIETKNAELKALQAQINPHFLYNSLDMIYWFAKDGMVVEIEKSVRALAQFYRIGLSNGREIITLREELSQAQAYMNLWNLRLRNTITFICKIDDPIQDFLIIKSTLQPLLENAISHGIREKDSPIGTIKIEAYLQETDILISISDDGIGIDSETLYKLNNDKIIHEYVGHGYGIHNVYSRLQLYYGSAYGLHFESTEGKGTTVTVKIPQRKTS